MGFFKNLLILIVTSNVYSVYACRVTHLQHETTVQAGVKELRVTGRIPAANWSRLKYYPDLESLSLMGTVVCGTPRETSKDKWNSFFSAISDLKIQTLDLRNQFFSDSEFLALLPFSIKTLDISHVTGITENSIRKFLRDRELAIITTDSKIKEEDFRGEKIRIIHK